MSTATLPARETLLALIAKHISQRSGIDFRSAMADYRKILQQGRDARAMLRAIELRESIDSEAILAGFRAFSGRLSLSEDGTRLEYVTGQYYPMEYRAAACAVLASILWDYWRDCKEDATGFDIRKEASRNLGRGIASRWFR
jgi:hypothetical protein